MVIDGVLTNKPSDPTGERAVGNGLVDVFGEAHLDAGGIEESNAIPLQHHRRDEDIGVARNVAQDQTCRGSAGGGERDRDIAGRHIEKEEGSRLRHAAGDIRRVLDPDIRSAEEILLACRFRFDGVIGVIGAAIDVDDPAADADRISCHMRAGRFFSATAAGREQSQDEDESFCVHRKRIS